MICKYCDKETCNPKFCSKSCSAKYNNKHYVKRKLTKRCKRCDVFILSKKVYCDLCKPDKTLLTIGDVRGWKGHKHPSWVHSYIRQRARAQYAKELSKSCVACDYSKHLELCHIKSITSFDSSTKVSIVNHETNVLFLCRNCHWEFDHGL
ncbi:hypothetical protein LCGC14_0914460 [marine sediment metagenome]|uniref:HNH nuclease domain-containing protein n=1 Tax=marine sediment metagenome TaxID=412755 RepID=A0A0F9RZB2_9ZZZZ